MRRPGEPEIYVIPPELDEHEPAPGWILIKPHDEVDQTTGGIVIARDPNGPQNMTSIRTGDVIAIGEPQHNQVPRNVKVGECATFNITQSLDLHIKGELHVQIPYAQLLGRSKPSEVRHVLPPSGDALVIAQNIPPTNGNGLPRPV